MCDKVIALIDMDCFYVQVEAREDPTLQGVPAVVVQYRTYKGGGIIAVNYEARAKGVKRGGMMGDDAREMCPGLRLVRVPEVREKADLTKYRKAGREVIEVLLQSGAVVERASIDEAYLDLTKVVEERIKSGVTVVPSMVANTHIGSSKEDRTATVETWLEEVGDEMARDMSDLKLAVGAAVVEEVRAEVYRQTQFRCSAGIAHCKTLAKLCCGLNKPNKQTVLPQSAVPELYSTLPVTKVRGLGGKLGESVVSTLGVQTMSDLSHVNFVTLERQFDSKTATWLHLLATQGLDREEVKERELPKSIGCGKNFRGPEILDTKEKVRYRLKNLVEELVERAETDKEEYNRMARGLTVSVALKDQGHVSRAGQVHGYNEEQLFKEAFSLLCKLNTSSPSSEAWSPKLENLSMSITKFEDLNATVGSTKSITSFFKKKEELGNCDVKKKESIIKCEEDKVPFHVDDEGGTKVTDTSTDPGIKSFFKVTNSVDQSINLPESTSNQPQELDNVTVKSTDMGIQSFFKATNSLDHSISLTDSINPAVQQEIIGENHQPHNLAANGSENLDNFNIAELIPSLEAYDESILELLPFNLRSKAKERVKQLRSKSTGISRFLVKDLVGTPDRKKGLIVLDDKENEADDSQSINQAIPPTNDNKESKEQSDLISCDQCSQLVSPFELPEHLDFHYALSLDREISGNNCRRNSLASDVGGASQLASGQKRKRSDGRDKADIKKQFKDISVFFNKQ